MTKATRLFSICPGKSHGVKAFSHDEDEGACAISTVRMTIKRISLSRAYAPRSKFDASISFPLVLPSTRSKNCSTLSLTVFDTCSSNSSLLGKNSFFSINHFEKFDTVSALAWARCESEHEAMPWSK
jgi:hypothetical protein